MIYFENRSTGPILGDPKLAVLGKILGQIF
jgi:hypothetical protein